MPNKVPEYTKRCINRYVEQHIPTGGFLKAILTNNLKVAVMTADSENINQIPEIVKYLINNVPESCWGSIENYEKWIGRLK